MNWQAAVERAVTALGYELADLERSAGGLLRVYIDHAGRAAGPEAPAAGGGEAAASPEGITVEDCERVTRQLQHVLEVEGCDYQRLEVSSPGLDRPLKKPEHYARFAGSRIELTLKEPFEGRKRYQGVLLPRGADWRLLFGSDDGKDERALDFSFAEVREARLVPVLDFKGRRSARRNDAARPAAPPEGTGGGEASDGGRIQ